MNSLRFCHRRFFPSFHRTTRYYSRGENTKEADSQSTVNQSEVNMFGSWSNDWWDENGPVKALHAMNEIRVQFIRSGLVNSGILNEKETHNDPFYLRNISIADIGCGGGILTLNLARLGSSVVGLEPSQDLIDIAKDAIQKFRPSGPTEFVTTSVEEFAKENPNTFDAVVCSEVIEHVSMKEAFVESCIKILKPGGSIFFTTMSRTIPGKLLSIYAAEYLLRLLPIGTHQYEKFITPEELSQILDKYSCDTKMVNGFLYCPINNTFYWVPSTSIQYALHGVKNLN